MTRRKVTMLEAFQDSARTSQERRDAALSRNQAAAGDRELGAEDPHAGTSHAGTSHAGTSQAGEDSRTAPSVHDGPAVVPVAGSSVGGTSAAETSGAAGARADESVAGASGAAVEAKPEAAAGLKLPFSGYGFAALQVLLLAGAFLLGRQFEEHGFGLRSSQSQDTAGQGGLEAASFGLPGWSSSSRQVPASGDAVGVSAGSVDAGAVGTDGQPATGEGAESEGSDHLSVARSGGGAVRGGAEGSLAPSDPDTAADRAYWDPAMRFTVLAASYTRSPANEALAWGAYDLLGGLGFPVVKPVSKGIRIFLHVGAAASLDELDGLRDELQNLRVGPRQRPEFRTAYVINIKRDGD